MKRTSIKVFYTLNFSKFPIIILIFGGIIRMFGYYSSSIRYDEALSLYRATLPFFQYLGNLQSYSSLMLWEIILRLISKIGISLWIIRLPAVLFGELTLFVVWKLMERFGFSKAQKLFASFIIAFCPGLIWLSQDARAYGLMVLIYLISILFLFERKWLGFFATNGLMIYTHVISPIFVIGSFAYGLALYPKEWKRLLKLGLMIILSWIPWVLLNLFQTSNQDNSSQFITTFWLGKLTFVNLLWQSILAFFVRTVDYPTSMLFIIAIVLSMIIVIKNSITKLEKNLLIFLTPFCVILIESVIWKNTLFFRTIIAIIIPFILSLSAYIILGKRKLLEWIIIVLWIFVTGVGIVGWNPSTRGGDVINAAVLVRENWQDGDVMYYGTGTSALPFDYYLSDKPAYLINGVANSNLTPPSLFKFQKIALEELAYKRAWVVFPSDIFIPAEQMSRLQSYVKEGELISRIKIFEIPDIFIYLVDL